MIGSLRKMAKNVLVPVMALSLVAQVSAAGNDEGSMVTGVYALKHKQQFVFSYHNAKEEVSFLVIRNASGEVIHSETVRNHTIQKVYDLSEYGFGCYTVEITSASGEKSTQEVILKP
jgi:hypothetical protein